MLGADCAKENQELVTKKSRNSLIIKNLGANLVRVRQSPIPIKSIEIPVMIKK